MIALLQPAHLKRRVGQGRRAHELAEEIAHAGARRGALQGELARTDQRRFDGRRERELLRLRRRNALAPVSDMGQHIGDDLIVRELV